MQRMLGGAYHIFFLVMVSSHCSHQAFIVHAVFFFAFRTYHACPVSRTYHVTSLGDLGLGGFAGLDSGLDS